MSPLWTGPYPTFFSLSLSLDICIHTMDCYGVVLLITKCECQATNSAVSVLKPVSSRLIQSEQ